MDFWAYPLRLGETLAANEWVELHVHRLMTSRFVSYALRDDRRDVIGTALLLWAECYRQDPAGTLPDDDVELAQLARYGADVARWQEVRDRVLHGWVPCHVEDGTGGDLVRLGHPFVAGIAERSFRRKSGKAQGREAARIANLKNRVKRKLLEMGQKKLAENDEVLRLICRWLDENDLYVTTDNVVAAMETIGAAPVLRVVKMPSDRGPKGA